MLSVAVRELLPVTVPGPRSVAVQGLMLAAVLSTGLGFSSRALADAAQDAGAIERATACKVLAQDAGARAAFPGVRSYLCGVAAPKKPVPKRRRGKKGKRKAAPTSDEPLACNLRTAATCQQDPLCTPTYSGAPCTADGGCPADHLYKDCEATDRQVLAAGVRHYAICKSSTGAWQRYDRKLPWPAACSCMGASAAGMQATRDGVTTGKGLSGKPRLYVGDRGCVAEQQLCAEHGGTWIEGPFRIGRETLSKADCAAKPKGYWDADAGGPEAPCTYQAEAGAESFTGHLCRVDGVRAEWANLGEPVGYRD